jgi:hypothetical protein
MKSTKWATFFASMRTAFLNWKEGVHIHFQRFRQNDQFGICDAAKSRFNFRECASTQIPSENRAAGSKHLLRQFLLITQFSDLRSDNILRFGHAPKTELDTKAAGGWNCSVIGAT